MFNQLLDSRSYWWLYYLVSLALFYVSFELGYGIGRRTGPRAVPEQRNLVGTVVTAQLALLSFLLAITFGIAADRFGLRKALLLAESNAIGTTFLRTDFLPEPQRGHLRAQLVEYVDTRIAAAALGADVNALIEKSEALHGAMWTEAAAVARADPHSLPVSLFVQVLNDTIDRHRDRVTVALRYRIPPGLMDALFLVAILSMATLGAFFGLSGARARVSVLGLLVAFGAVLFIIVELDRPAHHVFSVDQDPLIQTRAAMRP